MKYNKIPKPTITVNFGILICNINHTLFDPFVNIVVQIIKQYIYVSI